MQNLTPARPAIKKIVTTDPLKSKVAPTVITEKDEKLDKWEELRVKKNISRRAYHSAVIYDSTK